MDKLGQLTIVDTPLPTPCSKSVRVRNQIIGATVTILDAANNSIGQLTAAWPDEAISLTRNLIANEQIRAVQSHVNYESSEPSSPITVAVPPKLSDLARASFAPIFECAGCVALYDLAANAEVQVSLPNGQVIGKGVARDDGFADVTLDPAIRLATNTVLHAVQTACAATAPISNAGSPTISDPIQASPIGPLSSPKIQQPLVACMTAITVLEIQPGTVIEVYRRGQSLGKFCAPTSNFILTGLAGLQSDPADTLEVMQGYSRSDCRALPSARSGAVWAQITTPTVPRIGQLCAGQYDVQVIDLALGAAVEVSVGGKTYVFGASNSVMRFPVPPLTSGDPVIARQNLCGRSDSWSPWTNPPGKVNSSQPETPKPTSPPDQFSNAPTSVTLSWTVHITSCNAPSAFDVQVSLTNPFTNPIDHTVAGTSVPLSALKFDTTYYWRVRSKRGSLVASNWSPVFRFTTQKAGQPPGEVPTIPDEERGWHCFEVRCPDRAPSKVRKFGTAFEAYQQVENQTVQACKAFIYEVPCE